MTQEMCFKQLILPHLDDVIKGRILLFLDNKTIPVMYSTGLIKERKDTDNEDEFEVASGKWILTFDRKKYYVKSIKKNGVELYKYKVEDLNKTQPKMQIV